MNISTLKKIGLVSLSAIFCVACSSVGSVKNQPEGSENNTAANGKTSETASSSPCANRFYPVKDGLKRNYDNTIGGKTSLTIKYNDGEASFTEVTALKDVTVKHVWLCTNEGLVAANYGSAAEMKNVQVEPKHVSGVTLPKEAEILIGKTWITIYQATGTSQLGAVDMTVKLNNKIVSLDDVVKTPAGTFKAVKIEIDIVADMKFDGKKMPVPKIKSAAWFAPDVGMVKSTGGMGGLSNTIEYTGNN